MVKKICSLPDIAYLIIDRKVRYSHIYFLMDVPVILVEIKNNIFAHFLHNFQHRLRCISQPDGNVWVYIDKLLVVYL